MISWRCCRPCSITEHLPARHHEHQLRRVRGGQRRRRQRGVQNAYQTGVAEGWSIFVSAGDQGAGGCNFGGQTVTTASPSMGWARPSTTWPWAAPISAILLPTRTIRIGTPPTPRPSVRRSPTFRKFRGTRPAAASCLRPSKASPRPTARPDSATAALSSNNAAFYLENWAGSGGQSLCAQGTPSVSGVISGTCAGWPKPSWQSGLLGNPADTVRDLPDVSMFASFGPWNHAYAICYSDTVNGGTPCNGTASRLEHRLGRHVVRLADLGRHPGADQPVHRVAAGQSQSGAL